MKTLKDIEHFEAVRVFFRADFNVPIENGVVVDDFRIKAALPSIDFLTTKGADVILASHSESNDGENLSLEPIANKLRELGVQVIFIKDFSKAFEIIEQKCRESAASASTDPKAALGNCFLLENLRFFEGEKKNDPEFAKQLASFADIYVNDAFPVCHRKHASIVGVPEYIPAYAGLQLEKEVANLSRAFNPPHPFVFMLGGAKFETKLPLLEKFMQIADYVFVGGALSNDFFKLKGYEIGDSTVSSGKFDLSKHLNNPKLILPIDVITKEKVAKSADALSKNETIMDSGPKTLEMLKKVVSQAKCILWNGPLGLYETGFQNGTLGLAKIIGEQTKSGNGQVISIVGGGDTVAAIETLGIKDMFTFISTGGGAMLDFLSQGTLPGIQALEKASTN